MPTPTDRLPAFKAYDIRGRIPDELNRDLVYRIARAYASFVGPKRVAVGYDIRLTSPEFALAVTDGLTDSGVDVVDIGRCGTEEVYFATFHLNLDGGIMVTASHNPADYNGLKLVRAAAKPISADTGLKEIERLVLAGSFTEPRQRGAVERRDLSADYAAHLLTYVDVGALKPLKIVSNPGNGGAGVVMERLERRLPRRVAHEALLYVGEWHPVLEVRVGPEGIGVIVQKRVTRAAGMDRDAVEAVGGESRVHAPAQFGEVGREEGVEIVLHGVAPELA